jgi:hypothetical protein
VAGCAAQPASSCRLSCKQEQSSLEADGHQNKMTFSVTPRQACYLDVDGFTASAWSN